MRVLPILAVVASISFAVPAMAATFVGQDDGSAVGGPMPLSDAAATAYRASASTFGPVATINFDSSPNSDANSFSFPGVMLTKDVQVGNDFSGISNTMNGNLYAFDQSAGGGGKWFGFATGSATFSFAAPTNSFGFYISGVQETFSDVFQVTIDGTVYNAPINVSGGSAFFGYTSATAFSSATISRPGFDAWGIDNVSYNVAGVPEPMTWAMMVVGFGLVGGALRRRSATLSYS